MPRPLRQRIVTGQPVATVYKPLGVPARQIQWVTLTLDEFEAIRLIDGDGLDQEAVAGLMGVSRPTVTRILASARSKIAQVITHGYALEIQGGSVMQGPAMVGRGRGRGFGGGRGRGFGQGRGHRGGRGMM